MNNRKKLLEQIVRIFQADLKFFKSKDDRIRLIMVYQDIYPELPGLDTVLLDYI